MAGTVAGGKLAAIKNKQLQGEDFYKRIGAIGGKAGHTGGFAANHELARIAGTLGGRKSRLRRADESDEQYRARLNRQLAKARATKAKNAQARLDITSTFTTASDKDQ